MTRLLSRAVYPAPNDAKQKNTDVCANHVRISCRKIADHVAVWQYGHSLEFCISSRCAIRLQRASAKRVG